jgi:hypothetical protein
MFSPTPQTDPNPAGDKVMANPMEGSIAKIASSVAKDVTSQSKDAGPVPHDNLAEYRCAIPSIVPPPSDGVKHWDKEEAEKILAKLTGKHPGYNPYETVTHHNPDVQKKDDESVEITNIYPNRC